VFSTFLKMGDAFGITSPMARRVLLEVPQFALHVAMLGAVWRLTFRRVGVKGARAAMWLVALYGPLVWFGGRTMSESFSTAFLVWGLERLDSRGAKPAWWLLGGVLLGLAQVTRYGSAAAIVPAGSFRVIVPSRVPAAVSVASPWHAHVTGFGKSTGMLPTSLPLLIVMANLVNRTT
jgi:4-amino-4-deoxy-L-arabinose transferase-like glycosyltransferase